MAAIGAPGVVFHAVRLEATGSGNGAPPPPRNPSPAATPLLSVSRPSWIVRTESNVRKERKKRPDPPCVVCSGTGRVDCHHCCGRGAGPVGVVASAIVLVVLGRESTDT
ncbi:uncharacterized protein LOC127802766 isoform X2 [Diospyros lotus]|uniref:uncharacterized protein LOC127802766 isoform X2 n=1 Tax=Diospyros lotus TaxID=55363 RepID=UPI00225B1966|nr:uncharacterized protein LOC127802766 isoform X2 [Diospyros lotus]